MISDLHIVLDWLTFWAIMCGIAWLMFWVMVKIDERDDD